MTITMERVERPAPTHTAATTALARAEAKRMWRSPFYGFGVPLSMALCTVWGWTRLPTWTTFHENVGMASLVLAAALLIAAHLAAGRDRRAGAEESTRTTPTGPGRRSLALLVTVPIAAATGVLLYLAGLLLLLPAWPVGHFEPWAALIPIVIPAIGAAIGVAVGRLLPHVVTGPLTVVALAIVLLFLLMSGPSSAASRGSFPFPIPFDSEDLGVPYPFGWHLLYLLGLLALAVTAVTWPAAPKTSAVIAVVAVLFAGFSVQREAAGVPDSVNVDEVMRLTGPEVLECRTHEGVRYCALPGYGPWTDYWREAVEPVARLLPVNADKPVVRQIIGMDDLKSITPGYPEMVVGETWGRIGRQAADSRATTTRNYVATAVGLRRRDDLFYWQSCDGAGQHRTVVALWLLGRAAPGEKLTVPRVRYGPAEIQAADSLLAKPQDEVAGHLAGHWAEILDPSSTALAGLGVTIIPPPIPAGEPEETPSAVERGACR